MNISFTIGLLLLPYAAALAIAVIYGFISIQHLVKNGATAGVTIATTFFLLAGLAIIVSGTFLVLRDVDWTGPMTISPPSVNLELPGLTQP